MPPAAQPLTREQILAAAKEALRRYGPAKTTVVDVAQALGVSHGSVYRHFPTKAALREAVVREGLTAVSRDLGVIADEDGPAVDRLRRWLDALVQRKQGYAREDPELFENYHQISAADPGAVEEHVSVLAEQITAILRDGVAAGEVRRSALAAGGRAVLDATARFHNPAHVGEWSSPGIAGDYEAVWRLLALGIEEPTGAEATAGP
jgi:AcrR family transcriptional regulator